MYRSKQVLDVADASPVEVFAERVADYVELHIGEKTYCWTVEDWKEMVNLTVSIVELSFR